VVIPLVDYKLYQQPNFNFLWDEYTWDGFALFMDKEGVASELSVASPGFGAAVNCFMDLVNIKETIPKTKIQASIARKIQESAPFPLTGIEKSIALKPIKAGNELFAACKCLFE
jgi:hypothetical protein